MVSRSRISINSFCRSLMTQSVALLTITTPLSTVHHVFSSRSTYFLLRTYRPSVRCTALRIRCRLIVTMEAAKEPHSPESHQIVKTHTVASWAEGSNIVQSGPQMNLIKVSKPIFLAVCLAAPALGKTSQILNFIYIFLSHKRFFMNPCFP